METNTMDLLKLREPFAPEDIEWRIQQSGFSSEGNPWALTVPYLTSRAIMERLDDACGPGNWRNEFAPVPGGVLCGLSIRVNGEWVTKWDGAETPSGEHDDKGGIDPVKTALSNSMKRAAVQWGMGRHLYKLDAMFANICKDGIYQAIIKDKRANRMEKVRWNPPLMPGQSPAPAPARTEPVARTERREPPAPANAQSEPKQSASTQNSGDPEEQKRNELYRWLLDIAVGDEAEFKRLLRECSAFKGRDGQEHSVESVTKLKGRWLDTTHGRAHDKYDAWCDGASKKPAPTAPADDPFHGPPTPPITAYEEPASRGRGKSNHGTPDDPELPF